MNEQQRLYLVQARSDWEVFQLLNKQPVCHRLHYLQMCTEKLAKAYFWKDTNAADLGHAAVVKFVRSIAMNKQVAERLGCPQLAYFRAWIKGGIGPRVRTRASRPSAGGGRTES